MERFKKFMEERAGVDHLSLALMVISLVIFMIGKLLGWSFLTWLALAPLIHSYYRALSKDKLKRHQENILFLKYYYPVQTKVVNKFKALKSRRQYKYLKCKECGQKLRVPRKKGRIEITCPKCRHTFIKKT